jgi:hypothetical protein
VQESNVTDRWLVKRGLGVMVNDVAIVHTGEDREIAARIASRLRRQGLNVWIDPEALVWGWTPVESVDEAVENSRIILYLLSPAIENLVWVEMEHRSVFRLRPVQSKPRIIPVIVEKPVNPSLLMNLMPFDLTEGGSFDERLSEMAKIIERMLKKRAVFICHSSKDKPQVEPIVRSLRRRPKLAIWYDENSLKPGSVIRRGIEAGISDADYLVAVLSNHAIDTIEGWIGFELDQAYERERQRNLKGHYFVVPVLVESNVKIPGWLSTKVYVDLTKGFESGIRAIVGAVSAETPPE